MTDSPPQSAGPTPPALHAPALPPRAFSAIGLGVIALTLVLLATLALPVIQAWTNPPPPPVEPLSASKLGARKSEFTARLASAESKIKTRSPFSPPPLPIVKEPPRPARYGGPNVIGVAAGQVYFYDGKRIALGETRDDIKVIAIDAPWTVRLGWMGGEYDVVLIERNPVHFGPTPMPKDTLFKTVPIDSVSAPSLPRPRPQ